MTKYINGESVCEYCDKRIRKHPRCELCTVLLHSENKKYICRCGNQHTLRSKVVPTRCIGCENIKEIKYNRYDKSILQMGTI